MPMGFYGHFIMATFLLSPFGKVNYVLLLSTFGKCIWFIIIFSDLIIKM